MPAIEQADILWLRAVPLLLTGPTSAKHLALSLSVSQPTISRMLGRHRDQVVAVGKARATQYIHRRSIAEVGLRIPVFEVDEVGGSRELAVLQPVGLDRFYVKPRCSDVDERVHEGLPYFLDGMRPSGFLGRLVPRQHPELGLSSDIRGWSDDHVVRYLAKVGWNAVGNLIVGEEAFERYLASALQPVESIADPDCPVRYEQLADDVLAGAPPGSLAAGEQPKFLATRSPSRQVLVKFSPPRTNTVGKRVADLLVAECIALETIRTHGHDAARPHLVEGKRRLFLEVERFDRTDLGRRGVVSLEALDAEFVGLLGRGAWVASVQALCDVGVVPADVFAPVRWLATFGTLIGNTDMHPGNLSFITTGAHVLRLAPSYDMLPMHYAPRQGHLVDNELEPPLPKGVDRGLWDSACRAAVDFWTCLAEHPLTTRSFRKIAQKNAGVVQRCRALSQRLPQL